MNDTPMKAFLLSIGDELALGQTLDTNTQWLAQQLSANGCDVVAHLTVGDDQAAIEDAIAAAWAHRESPELLLITGGLGPTDDDLTRQAIARAMGGELVLNEQWLAQIREFFRQRGRAMPERNSIQAMIPAGATMIWNHVGTAAGIAAARTEGGRSMHLIAMPGVPKEMKPMFEQAVLPLVRQRAGGAAIVQRTLHTFGLGESAVAEMLGDLMQRGRNPSVGTTVSNNVVSLRINGRFGSPEAAEAAVAETVAACRAKLGDLVYGQDGQSLAEIVGTMLADSRSTVATAESCTGGLLAKLLTDVSGASAYFQQGFVTYSNAAKRARLGVSENLIHVHGAVSEPVVLSMARGARRLADSTYALAVSGVAGPTGGTPAKPVGTVCIALAHLPPPEGRVQRGSDREDEVSAYARTFNFPGDREMIRDRAAKMALAMLRFRLLGKPLPF